MREENSGDPNDTMNVSAQVDRAFLEDFDRSITKAQIEGQIPMDVSRAKVIRGLIKLASKGSELIADAVKEDQQ